MTERNSLDHVHVYEGKGWITKLLSPKQYQNWIKASQIITAIIFVLLMSFFLSKLFGCGVNRSASVNARVFFVNKMQKDIHLGDLVTFKYYGNYYPHGMSFTKYVGGMPGDVVSTDVNNNFYINGQFVGQAKEVNSQFEPILKTQFKGVIPPGKFWFYTLHPDSFDSRYELAGLGDLQDIEGKTYIVF